MSSQIVAPHKVTSPNGGDFCRLFLIAIVSVLPNVEPKPQLRLRHICQNALCGGGHVLFVGGAEL